MEPILNGTIVLEGALLSFMLALWITWLALRGLFRLMPLTSRSAAGRVTQHRRALAQQQRA
jgi:hypothetical protein